jgi:hypothetical protein
MDAYGTQYSYMEAFGGYDTSLIVANVNAVEFELRSND